MHDCEHCGMPYTSLLAAAECADQDRAEDAEHRRGARRMTRRLQVQRWPDRDDD